MGLASVESYTLKGQVFCPQSPIQHMQTQNNTGIRKDNYGELLQEGKNGTHAAVRLPSHS